MHIPDSDPGCALQSTSMPALHGRNVPNCRPMADAGMRKYSAGVCPQPWARRPPNDHQRRCRGDSRNALGGPATLHRPANSSCRPSLRHWYENRPLRRPVVRDSRHPIVNPAPNSSFRRRPESKGRRGWHKWHPNGSNNLPTFSYLGVPVPTGMSDWYENDVTRFGKCFGVPEIFRIVIRAKAGIQKGWGWGM